jgi:hypothetical protein
MKDTNGEMVHYETKPVHGACVNDLNRDYLDRYRICTHNPHEKFSTH